MVRMKNKNKTMEAQKLTLLAQLFRDPAIGVRNGEEP